MPKKTKPKIGNKKTVIATFDEFLVMYKSKIAVLYKTPDGRFTAMSIETYKKKGRPKKIKISSKQPLYGEPGQEERNRRGAKVKFENFCKLCGILPDRRRH